MAAAMPARLKRQPALTAGRLDVSTSSRVESRRATSSLPSMTDSSLSTNSSRGSCVCMSDLFCDRLMLSCVERPDHAGEFLFQLCARTVQLTLDGPFRERAIRGNLTD